jgi:hypothetical protein
MENGYYIVKIKQKGVENYMKYLLKIYDRTFNILIKAEIDEERLAQQTVETAKLHFPFAEIEIFQRETKNGVEQYNLDKYVNPIN